MTHQPSIHWYADKNTAPDHALPLHRRGFELGWVTEGEKHTSPDRQNIIKAWKADESIMLPDLVTDALQHHAASIQSAYTLMEKTLNGAEVAGLLESDAYAGRLQPEFALVASSIEEHDEQGIEKLYFDTEATDNLWCKASWLSFHDEDASLRFRFSFGVEGFEDVAADAVRQQAAGVLCDKIFPESSIITENSDILAILHDVFAKNPTFVERIVYFNAPNGGAQFHHDVERGHDGVVFAQLSGSTFWLSLAKPVLMDEMIMFATHPNHAAALHAVLPEQKDRDELEKLLKNRQELSEYMDEADHEWVEALIDRSPAFISFLINKGYAHILHAGDVLLLPQRDLDHCVWHSVFTLGDEPGEALSFAVRPVA